VPTRLRFLITGALCWVALQTSTRAATSSLFHFAKVADTHTPRPGALGLFTGFGIPSSIGFVASGDDGAGVYRSNGPSIEQLADTHTPIPGGSGTFTGFDAPSYESYFHATGTNGQQGIYQVPYQGAALNRYVDTNTPIPGGSGTFTTFGPHVPFGAFYGEGTGGQKGIYVGNDVIADTRTPVPDRPGAFFDMFASVNAYHGNILFHAGSGSASAVYRPDNGGVTAIVDPYWRIDSPAGPPLGAVDALGTGMALGGVTVLANPGHAVYFVDFYGFRIGTVATPTQMRPDAPEAFGDILDVASGEGSIEGGPVVAFRVGDAEHAQIYFRAMRSAYEFPAQVIPIIGAGDILDGRQVSTVDFGDDALNGYSITFRAQFTDGSSGIFKAGAPELVPEPILLAPTALLLLTLHRPRRRPVVGC
jgi:hypothetical protein